VLRLAYSQIPFLLSGDVETETEAVLLLSNENQVHITLKSPHHGSDTSLHQQNLDKENLLCYNMSEDNLHSTRKGDAWCLGMRISF
jgi:hypothetical protein